MTALQGLDLNLLRVMDAVMQQGSVVGAARKLSVTPSAVSHALARLRKAFREELFVNSEAGMAPTPRAQEIYQDVERALEHIRLALERAPFDPLRSSRSFDALACHISTLVVLPPLLRRLSAQAPGVSLNVAPLAAERLGAELEEGRAQLAIGQFGALPEKLVRKTLQWDEEVILCRPDHPLCKRPATWDQALTYPKVIVGVNCHSPLLSLEKPPVAATGSDLKGRRSKLESPPARIVVQDYAAVSAFLEDSDLIAVGPRRLAKKNAGRLAVVEPIDRRRQVKTELVWHARSERDEGLNWLGEQIVQALAAEPA
jgi:DNA-binding transcriptional LysR family regulator